MPRFGKPHRRGGREASYKRPDDPRQRGKAWIDFLHSNLPRDSVPPFAPHWLSQVIAGSIAMDMVDEEEEYRARSFGYKRNFRSCI